MQQERSCSIPKGMTNEVLAETFTAYLLGSRALADQRRGSDGEYQNGPFKRQGDDTRWQLEGSNDYWLHIEDGTARLICRYKGQDEVVDAMMKLFLVQFGTAHKK